VRHQRSLKTNNKREAELRERDFREELDIRRHKQINLNPEMPFSELATQFLGSPSARPHHDIPLRNLLPYFGSTPLSEISRPQADVYRKERKAKDGVVDATVNRDLQTMRHVLFFALDAGILLANPLSRVRMVPERRKRRPVLSLEEEPKLLAVTAGSHLHPIIITALDTGMRRGELLAQIGEDIDVSRGILAVTHSKTAGGEQREIPLTNRMHEVLRTLPKRGLLFTYKGERIEKLRRSWGTAIRKSGIRPLQFKQLRHTFNTRLMEAGVIRDVRMALMGHSQGSAETTNDLYTHIDIGSLREAIRKLETWCAEHGPKPTGAQAVSHG
jgi:integrase